MLYRLNQVLSMKVRELIQQLQQVEDKDLNVVVRQSGHVVKTATEIGLGGGLRNESGETVPSALVIEVQ